MDLDAVGKLHIWASVNFTIPMSDCVVRKLQVKNTGHTYFGRESFVENASLVAHYSNYQLILTVIVTIISVN